MIVLKNFKIFTVAVLCCVVYIEARSISTSQVGDVHLEQSDEKWQCDRIECPADTDRCYVSKEKDPNDPAVLVRTNICYSKDNQALAQSITTSAIDPNTDPKMYITVYQDGSISYSSSYTNADFDKEKFDEELNKNLDKMNAELEDEMKKLQQGLSNMEYELAHMFD